MSKKAGNLVKDRGEDSSVDIMKFKIILCQSAVMHIHVGEPDDSYYHHYPCISLGACDEVSQGSGSELRS